jgi:glycosyltransferase involved in cell wall biosynthesis
MRIVAVVPAYNEAQAIGAVIADLLAADVGVVVVDDGSADETAEQARVAGARVLRHAINRGQGAALQTGITAALQTDAEIIVTFDADGQFSAGDISALVAPIVAGTADVTLGSRFLGEAIAMPTARRLLVRLVVAVTRLYTGLRITDAHNGLRAFSAAAAARINLRQDRMAHASEILEQIAQQRLRYVEVPVAVHYSAYSLAKGQKMSGSFHIVWDLFVGRLRLW